ncbi:hypothetical protein Tco_1094180 [Tanacetum coccineum]|uniref:Uncharacterized protein n=1 Tax=Tanacetum coccineum TaxID=301880 RepID=A0ABQ5IH61_9ASTR
MYAELGLTDSETESDEKVSLEFNVGTQDEGQAGPNPSDQDEGKAGLNPGIQDEGQAGSNPGDAAESQPQSSHVVHAGPNLEHMDFEVTNDSTQQHPEQMDEEFTTMAYPSVQETLKLPTKDQVRLEEPASFAETLSSLQNLDKELSFTNQFLVEKSQEDEPDKSNTEAEVQSMVTVPIHQDTSSVPLMSTPVIDLTISQPVSTTVQAPLPTSTATVTSITTTSLPPPSPQPQQSTTDLILVRRIGELKQHMADLLQDNLALGERLDKHGTWLYNLEKLDIPHKVSQAIDEIVIDARMFEDNSYNANNVHKDLYKALQKSLELDYSNQRLLPPPPPPAGASGAPVTSRASSSSKTTTSAQQSKAWTTFDTKYESTGIAGAQELSPSDDLMYDDSAPNEQVHVFDDQDSRDDHTPAAAADLRKDWWKPLPEEERPANPEPA